MMWLIIFGVPFLVFFNVNISELISDENEARKFLVLRDEALYNTCVFKIRFDLDMTTQNFTWQNFNDPVLRRAFQLIAQLEDIKNSFAKVSHLNESKREVKIKKEMIDIFDSSGACIYDGTAKSKTDDNCTMINPTEIDDKFNNIRDFEERKYYWIAWRTSVGKMRSIYEERMKILKTLKIFPNYNEWWLHPFEDTAASLHQDLETVWREIFPLYKEFHAFIRRRLIGVYGSDVITSNGPIPSHLLGLWMDFWWSIKDIILPYPEGKLNITEVVKKKAVFDLFKLGEEFYHSMGLPYFDNNIWNNTHFVENAYCPSEFDYNCKNEVSGINACVPLHELNLHKVLGYSMEINIANLEKRPDWPRLYHRLPTPAFTFALRHAGELSSWTTDYLHQTGFIEDIPMNYGNVTVHDINLLMKVALRFLPSISYKYKVMKWRWDSFDFLISDKDYNKKWWEYSLEYQGICPPVRRTEEDFDPASSLEIAANFPAISDFIGIIYGFQFYKAACEEAEHTDLLHRCNLYGVKTFGDKIRRLVYLGKSITPAEGVSLMTNGESVSMSTKPILEYFQPLYEWLRRENGNKVSGWHSNDPMQCP